jgi:hypothetical protein
MRRPGRTLLATTSAIPLLLAVVLMATRVDDVARFVTWPVVAFTALAALVACIGIWVGADEPVLLAAGLLPAIVLSYFLPAAPFVAVAVCLAGFGVLAVSARGVAAGVAAGTGALMVLFVVLQGPAVECGRTSVSSSSGPWWVEEPSSSTGSGSSMSVDGRATGTVDVGGRRYAYVCDGGELRDFERASQAARPTA